MSKLKEGRDANLGYRLGTFRDGVFGKFTREDKTDRGLDFTGGDGRLLRVGSELWLQSMSLDQVISKKEYWLEASVAIRSKISLTKELRMAIALLEIPVSGCTCLSTASPSSVSSSWNNKRVDITFVNVRRVSLLPCFLPRLLLLTVDGYSGLLSCLLRSLVNSLCWGLGSRSSSRSGSLSSSWSGFYKSHETNHVNSNPTRTKHVDLLGAIDNTTWLGWV